MQATDKAGKIRPGEETWTPLYNPCPAACTYRRPALPFSLRLSEGIGMNDRKIRHIHRRARPVRPEILYCSSCM